MENQEKLKRTFLNVREQLHETLAPFYVILALIAIGFIVIISNTELIYNSESFVFYLPFIPMAAAMWFAHKKMVKDPILRAIAAYVHNVKKSQLTGDELIKLELLPKDKDLNKISKYSMGLQRDIYREIFQGLKDLTFSTTEDTPIAYQQTVKLIGIASGNEKKS